MYNLLISFYFSFLFDVLHEKLGLSPWHTKNNIKIEGIDETG